MKKFLSGVSAALQAASYALSAHLRGPVLGDPRALLCNYEDSLLRIYSRQYFRRLMEGALQSGRVFTLALWDLDHFATINNKLGHLMGDQVLIQISNIITRESFGAVGRLGGEEFGILIKDLPSSMAQPICENIRRRIEKAIPMGIHVTASCGLAGFPEDGRSWSDLVRHADEALYYAKQHGRNQVVVWSREMAKVHAGGDLCIVPN